MIHFHLEKNYYRKLIIKLFIVFEKKLTLKEKSNLRVKNWPNTLEAKRKKKDEARFERFRAEEVII